MQVYEWEEAILQLIEDSVDPRKIYWVLDRKGGAGKSTFCKYLMYQYKDKCAYFNNART